MFYTTQFQTDQNDHGYIMAYHIIHCPQVEISKCIDILLKHTDN